MPKLPKKPDDIIPENPSNGQPHSTLGDCLARHARGTDDIEIGTGEEVYETITATLEDASELVASIKYLLRDWIPFGMVTLVMAEPGIGKSAFVLWLVRTIVMALNWFTGAKGPKEPCKVLWCATENDTALTVDRAKKWGIPKDMVLLPFENDPLGAVNLTDPKHLRRIKQDINAFKTPLVVIDSLRGGHDTDENSSRMSAILQGLAEIAETTKAAVVVIHHSKKLGPGQELTANSSRGSGAIIAMCRSVIGIDIPDLKKPQLCRARVLKQNLGIAPKPIGFRITDHGLKFESAPEKAKKDTRKQHAVDWLKSKLKPGEWCEAIPILQAAQDDGIKDGALQRAREELGITTENGCIRKRDDGHSEWTRLPDWAFPEG